MSITAVCSDSITIWASGATSPNLCEISSGNISTDWLAPLPVLHGGVELHRDS